MTIAIESSVTCANGYEFQIKLTKSHSGKFSMYVSGSDIGGSWEGEVDIPDDQIISFGEGLFKISSMCRV